MNHPSPTIERDERLARLLDQLQLAAPHEQPHALELACQQHPDLAHELRQLATVGQVVEALARSSKNLDPQATQIHAQVATAVIPDCLPRAFGPYDLQEELGRGGMGIVYKAWDPTLQRHVALKLILRGVHASAADLARFRAEAQAAAGLEHPNIVSVYQVGDHDGQAYFCMKLVEGRPLSALLAEGPLRPRRAAEIVVAVAHAIQHAHDRGILHRDLKPANILLPFSREPGSRLNEATPMVTDFGLAKRVEGDSRLTGTGAILGTPSYMAPEQTMGQAGPAADIYSLGAILYELLTGRPPFLAPSILETILLVRSEEPVRPRELNPQIDLDLEFICRKCLEKRPEHRYASAGDLARDLEAYLQGEPVAARSSSLVYFITRLFRESHHAPVLENWGLLWIWHSAMVMALCVVTSGLHYFEVRSHWPFMALWTFGLLIWGIIFWNLRRRLGPVTFVERQIAHAWGAGVAASIGVFWVEVFLGQDVLTLTPVLAICAGMVFLVKAGILSGWFYIAAVLSFVAVVPMILIGTTWGPVIFGVVTAVGFLVPGVKYYRIVRSQRRR